MLTSELIVNMLIYVVKRARKDGTSVVLSSMTPSFFPSFLLLRMSEHFMKQFIEQKLLSSICYMYITLKRNQELFHRKKSPIPKIGKKLFSSW